MQCDSAIATYGVSGFECWRVSAVGVGGAVPGQLVAGSLIVNAGCGFLDGEV